MGERPCWLGDPRGRVPLLLQALDVLGQRQLLAEHLHGRVEGRGDLVRGGQRLLLGGRQRVVGVGGHRHRLRGVAQGVPRHPLVAVGAQRQPDGRVVLRLGADVVDEADVEAELAGELGLELADLELDDDVAQLLDVKGQQAM